MKVIDLASSIIITISTESSMREVLDVLSKDPSGRVVVLKEEKPIGIVSTRDVVASFSEYGLDIINLKAKDIMSQDLVSVSPNEEVNEVVRLMLSKGIGGAPIVDNN
ncbi:histidine kinase, partial [Sulfolobus sp. A20-N-G8]